MLIFGYTVKMKYLGLINFISVVHAIVESRKGGKRWQKERSCGQEHREKSTSTGFTLSIHLSRIHRVTTYLPKRLLSGDGSPFTLEKRIAYRTAFRTTRRCPVSSVMAGHMYMYILIRRRRSCGGQRNWTSLPIGVPHAIIGSRILPTR